MRRASSSWTRGRGGSSRGTASASAPGSSTAPGPRPPWGSSAESGGSSSAGATGSRTASRPWRPSPASRSPPRGKSTPVLHEGHLYVTLGGDIWWGKNEAWLQRIDATKKGDTTGAGPVWSYPLKRHVCATPAIQGGLAFVGDLGRTFHCVDIETGKACWTHEARGEIWASALVADGKVYVGTNREELLIFEASREKRLISAVKLDGPMFATPVAANGVLYIATMHTLYAVEEKAGLGE